MKENELITQILEREEFRLRPPVLVDIGASGAMHSVWAAVAPYAVCLAFDADERDIQLTEKENSGYKKLILFHNIVTPEDVEESDFHLTKSPHCSSLLQPDHAALAPWSLQPLFEEEKTVRLKSITLAKALRKSGFTYVDWFKTDSQGMDLRLFKSLGDEIIRSVKIAEFEPGLIDAYHQEDKFDALLRWMADKPFFLDSLAVQHIHRIRMSTVLTFLPSEMSPERYSFFAKQSPGWVNALFLNTGENTEQWELRDNLLFLLSCILRRQFGMVYEFASSMSRRYPEETVFSSIVKLAEENISRSFHRPFRRKVKDRLHRLIETYL